MSTDPAEKEREFIAEIEVETGRDLAGWMRAIDAQATGDRNGTIDWLKAEHVFFRRASRAMWLERIHHNGGRPIYDGTVDVHLPTEVPKRAQRIGRAGSIAAEPAVVAPETPRATAADASSTRHVARADGIVAASPAEIEALLARGKAYRPLAAMLLAEIRKRLPDVVTGVAGELIVLGHPALFAAIEPRPKEVRLGLAIHDLIDGFEKSKLTGAPAAISTMCVLTDARAIDAALIDLVRRTAATQ